VNIVYRSNADFTGYFLGNVIVNKEGLGSEIIKLLDSGLGARGESYTIEGWGVALAEYKVSEGILEVLQKAFCK
jgi:hypothetical protein